MRYNDRDAYSRKLLRSPNGVIFGVCEGFARRLGISIKFTRLVTFIAFLVTGFFPVGLIYCLLALVMDKGPY